MAITTFGQTIRVLPLTSVVKVYVENDDKFPDTITMTTQEWLEGDLVHSLHDYQTMIVSAKEEGVLGVEIRAFHGCTNCGSKYCHGDFCK